MMFPVARSCLNPCLVLRLSIPLNPFKLPHRCVGLATKSFHEDICRDKTTTHGVLVLIMFCSWKRLSQRVCNIQIRMYFANLYVSHLDQVPDGIEASLDVLGSLVKSGFLR